MSTIKASDSVEKLLGHFHVSMDEAEKWNQHGNGNTTMQYPDEMTAGLKLRDLLLRGIPPERICWTRVSKTCFVIVRQ